MYVRYSERSKNKLLSLLESRAHLGDFDALFSAANDAKSALRTLRGEADGCLFDLERRISQLEAMEQKEEWQIKEAKRDLAATPTVKTVYPDSYAAARGERPVTRNINQDTVAKYREQIAYHEKRLQEITAEVETLKEDRSQIMAEYSALDEVDREVDEIISALYRASEEAEKNCRRYVKCIKKAAGYMDDYRAARGGKHLASLIGYIKEKEAW